LSADAVIVTATLSFEPRWALAAQALVDGCIDLPHDEDRVALLVAVCEGLGEDLYPAFLRVLSLIGQHGDYAARTAVAQALVHALRTGRLPSGRRAAWGASAAAGAATAGAPFGSRRSLGPLEYLCAWYAQAEPSDALSADQFSVAAASVMDLVAASDDARLLYCEKLLADVSDPLCGAYTRQTRDALRALAIAWSEGATAAEAGARFLSAVPAATARGVTTLIAPPAYMTR
jgi:hypothetical protein